MLSSIYSDFCFIGLEHKNSYNVWKLSVCFRKDDDLQVQIKSSESEYL